MSENHVYVTMLIETDRAPEDEHLAILAALSDRHKIIHSGVRSADDDNDPDVTFVVCPVRGLLGTFVDNREEATEFAEAEGAVIVELTADADYRTEVTA